MSLMFHGLDTILRLTHPFMQFITEGLWQGLDAERAEDENSSIMSTTYPDSQSLPDVPDAHAKSMGVVLELLALLRSLAGKNKGEKQTAGISTSNEVLAIYLKDKIDTLSSISKVRVEITAPADVAHAEAIPAGDGEVNSWRSYRQKLPDGSERLLFVYAR